MRRRIIFVVLATILATISTAQAQQPAKMPKIGFLTTGSGSGPGGGFELLRRELRAFGYVDGKNVAFEYRFADNKLDRLPALADELVRLKVDVLLAFSTPTALAAKNATRTIPIVFHNVADPVAVGLVDSFARPGGNVTGSVTLRRCWPANDWSYSRKPFPSSPVLRYCGILRIQAMRSIGKKANYRHKNWVCNFIPWR
jgi:putative ABC transport system substrate-binding protein